MPLFVIPIIAGALVLGATTVDVTGDNRELRAQAHQAQMVQQQQQYQVFRTMAECQQAMMNQGLPASSCRQT